MTRCAVAGGVLLVAVWGWTAAFSWLDVSAWCRVKIEVELLEGERGPIKEAIAARRREDPAVISLVQVDPALARAHAAAGCYMRGSRVIVLRRPRDGENSAALLRERVEALKRSAGYARAFWTGAPR